MPLLPTDDLFLCPEEAAEAFADDQSPGAFPDQTEDLDEAVALELERGGNVTLGSGHLSGSVDDATRRHHVDWVLKVCSHCDFQPLTAYLAVNYLDRFLSCHSLTQLADGWPMQLLSVACLSLAAKMEEIHVPALLDLQVEDASFIFEPQTVCRMELLVLTALDWRLRSCTPFPFLYFFSHKADLKSMTSKSLIKRASMVILELIKDIESLEYNPSSIAAAAFVYACNGISNLAHIGPENVRSWCPTLVRDDIENCYQLICELTLNGDKQRAKQRIQRSLRVTTTIAMGNGTSFTPSKRSRS